MEKKRYIVPVVGNIALNYPLMSALGASEVPGDVHAAPARRPELGGNAPVF